MNLTQAERIVAQERANERYRELQKLIDVSGHGRNYSERLIAWRKRLKEEIRHMAIEGVGINAITEYVHKRIRDDESGSIR